VYVKLDHVFKLGLKVFEFEKNVPELKPKDLKIGRIRLNSHLKNLQKWRTTQHWSTLLICMHLRSFGWVPFGRVRTVEPQVPVPVSNNWTEPMLGIKFGTGAKILVFPKNHQARTGILDFFQEPDWNSGLIKTLFLFLKRTRIGVTGS